MTTYQRFDEDADGCRQGVYVCGARQGSNNIGEAVVEAFAARGWDAIGDDCAVGDGSRPPGGNLPDDETAEKFGYTVTDKGRYQRFTAPSVDSFFPFTNGTLYCAAKAGLDMAARTLGWELTDRGYRVHVVHPYHVNGTPMWAQVEQDVMRTKNMTWEEADAYNRKDLKMPDLLTPEEVAEVITTLVTVPAMGWMSGQPVNLYGGSR
jgi:NAD(P)-dependent dehydrogenase (short-subunit alcohol dehydrogenase family)